MGTGPAGASGALRQDAPQGRHQSALGSGLALVCYEW
jgi:hypothetical protein